MSAARMAGALGMGLFSNVVATPIMYGAGTFLKGAIRWTIQDWSAGQSLMRLGNKMTGMWETVSVTNADGKKEDMTVFNYGWQSHQGIMRDLSSGAYKDAQADQKRREGGDVALGSEWRNAIRAGVAVAAATAVFIPFTGGASLVLAGAAAAGALVATRLLQAKGRDLDLIEKNQDALAAYEEADGKSSGGRKWTDRGGVLDRMAENDAALKRDPNDAAARQERGRLQDEVWSGLSGSERQKWIDQSGGNEDAAKRRAFNHFMPAATLKDKIWDQDLKDMPEERMREIAGTGPAAGGSSVGKLLGRVGVGSDIATAQTLGMTEKEAQRVAAARRGKKSWDDLTPDEKKDAEAEVKQMATPYDTLLDREAKRQGRGRGDIEDDAKRDLVGRLHRARTTKAFGLAKTDELERGGRTKAADRVSRKDAEAAAAARHGSSWDTMSSADKERQISKRLERGLDDEDADALLRKGSPKFEREGLIRFDSLSQGERERLISESPQPRADAIKSMRKNGVSYDDISDGEKERLRGEVKSSGHVPTRAERFVEEKTGRTLAGVMGVAALALAPFTGGLSLLATGAAFVHAAGVTDRVAQSKTLAAVRDWGARHGLTRRNGLSMTKRGLKWFALTSIPGGALLAPAYAGARSRAEKRARATGDTSPGRTSRGREVLKAGAAFLLGGPLGLAVYGAWRMGKRAGRSAVQRERDDVRRIASIDGLNEDAASRLYERGANTPMHIANMSQSQLYSHLSDVGVDVGGVDAARVREAAENEKSFQDLGFSEATAQRLEDAGVTMDGLRGKSDQEVYDELAKGGVQRAISAEEVQKAAGMGVGLTGVDAGGQVRELSREQVEGMAKMSAPQINAALRGAGVVTQDDALDRIHDSAKERSREMDPKFTHLTDAHDSIGLREADMLRANGVHNLSDLSRVSHGDLTKLFRSSGYDAQWGGAGGVSETVSEMRDNASQAIGHGSVSRMDGMTSEQLSQFQDMGYDTTADIAFEDRGSMIDSGISEDARTVKDNAAKLSEAGVSELDGRLFEGTSIQNDADAQSRVLAGMRSRNITTTEGVGGASGRDLLQSGLTDDLAKIQGNAKQLAGRGYDVLDAKLFEGTSMAGDEAAQQRTLSALRTKGLGSTKDVAQAGRWELRGVRGVTNENVDSIQANARRLYAKGSEERIRPADGPEGGFPGGGEGGNSG